VRLIAASMPSGVEHANGHNGRPSRAKLLIAASMPSGVEHNTMGMKVATMPRA